MKISELSDFYSAIFYSDKELKILLSIFILIDLFRMYWVASFGSAIDHNDLTEYSTTELFRDDLVKETRMKQLQIESQ